MFIQLSFSRYESKEKNTEEWLKTSKTVHTAMDTKNYSKIPFYKTIWLDNVLATNLNNWCWWVYSRDPINELSRIFFFQSFKIAKEVLKSNAENWIFYTCQCPKEQGQPLSFRGLWQEWIPRGGPTKKATKQCY